MKRGFTGLIRSAGLLWMINSCIVDAGIFIKAKDPLIIQEAVWLYSNSTAITSIAPDVPANKFSLTVAPIDNLPQASVDGTSGVLYNREDSCSSSTIDQPIPIPFYAATAKESKVPKIALIKKQGGNCTTIEKIKNAQLEGAIGAILYDSNGSTNVQDRKAGVPPNNDIKIPAFYVDHKVGLELYYQLQKMAAVPIATIPTFDNTPLTTRISVRISLMPADNVKPNAWELTLLVMLILLGTSISFSVAMHLYMWRRNRRLQEMVERHRVTTAAAAILPMGKALLTLTRLHQFPTRTVFTVLDEEERKKIETVLLDEKKREALKMSTALNTEPKRKSVFSKPKLRGKQSPVVVDAVVNNMCVICLEAFRMGDEVRELPCYHEYHTACIDPWLTSKSCECPLCKFDCSDLKTKEPVADSDGLRAAESAPSIYSKILQSYHGFKANRRKKIGQIGITNDMEQQQPGRSVSRQSTLMSSTPPDLRSAFRALETVEINELPITSVAAIDEHYQAFEDAAQPDDEQEDTHSVVTDLPRQSTATDRTATTNYRANTYSETESHHPRYSIATINRADDTDTIHTTTANSISTYAPTSDGGLLPDIDVSSISLCSIDLGGLSEDFHNTFNYHR